MNACRGKRKSKIPKLSNQRGQFAIEAVLLTALLIGTFVFVTGIIKEKKMMAKLLGGPVKSMRNMTGFGTFRDSCTGLGSNKKKQTLSNCHPNSITRALSSDPK